MEGGGRLFRNARRMRYARVGRRGCGLIPVAWMPGLIILRHRRCRKGPAQGPSRLQHDVTAAPIRVLADFILTQPARPDFRVQIWAPWRTWARQSEVICNPTEAPFHTTGMVIVMSSLRPPCPGPGSGILDMGTAPDAESGLGCNRNHYRMAPVASPPCLVAVSAATPTRSAP